MAITQVVDEDRSSKGSKLLVHRCECGATTDIFRLTCDNCKKAYFDLYARLY